MLNKLLYKKFSLILSVILTFQTYFGFVVLRQFDLLHLHGIKQIVMGFRSESSVITFPKLMTFSDNAYNLQSDSGLKNFISIHEALLPNSQNEISIPTYSKLPHQLPRKLQECSRSLELDKSLLQVDEVISKNTMQYIFLNSYPLLGGVKLTSLSPNCTVNFVRNLQKTNTSWLLSSNISIDLPLDQFPARMDISGNSGFLMTRFGRLYKFETNSMKFNASLQKINSGTEFKSSNASELNGIAGEGVKSILALDNDIYYSLARVINGCGKLQLFKYSLKVERESIVKKLPFLIFQTKGCFKGPEVNLGAVGGRIIAGEGGQKGNLIFSIGNPEIWQGSENIDPRGDLGRIVSINIRTHNVTSLSSGHRNPQGLCFQSKSLWATEQGPEGGDEINLIKKNRNYGWPYVTMGHAYGALIKQGSIKPFSDFGFERPIFNFVPSVAAGALKCPSVSSPIFFNSDFFMATLRDTSIHRLRIENSRLVLDERIPMGARIRDINWLPNGELMALTDNGELIRCHFVYLET